MAFDLDYFLPLSAMANSNVPRVFLYKDDTDSLATIVTDDYFLNQYLTLNVGDIIRVWAAGAVNSVDLIVTATAVGGVTVVVGAGGTADLIATNALVASQSGGVFFLNAATEFVTTLPAPAPGLRFTFICKTAPVGASYTIVTEDSDNIIIGHINEVTVDDTVDGDIATAGDTITFTDGAAAVGDRVDLISDGTSWYVVGQCAIATGIALSAAS